MNGINHLVLAGHDLGAMRRTYEAMGFKISPPGQHPFGTGNTIIQLHGNYLELLAVTVPEAIVEHRPGVFSFSAFNRDYLSRHEGFSMVVLDSRNAGADRKNWAARGLPQYEAFEFSRPAKLASGEDVTVGFSLAFTSNSAAPWLGLFACQHYNASFYQQPENQEHSNGARTVSEVWVSGEGALGLRDYFEIVTGTHGTHPGDGRVVFSTATGDIVLSSAEAFRAAFGHPPSNMQDGPHLAGYTIAVSNLDALRHIDGTRVGEKLVVDPSHTFGTCLAFAEQR
ncbi:VOC family protein [Rhizobium sp. TH2]|uniref:VOC family protein n=1 Tax=Rhizobium sp. TH2 TaxID=2775403 RepID=UPI002157A5F7|nr:VOC family protein [Rhizobium sp. TH2]UVC10784.1 VOC family protein [Rhizobium sp. TH2]